MPKSDRVSSGNVADYRLGYVAKVREKWFEFIVQSFLPEDMKESFKKLISEKLNIL